MLVDRLHFSVGHGLTIALTPNDPPGAPPTAIIHVRSRLDDVSEEGRPQENRVMIVTISSGRLRTLLGNGPMAEAILARSSEDGEVRIPVPNFGVVRRIAEDIRHTPYDGSALALYLQGKVLELLVEGLNSPELDEERRIALTLRDILLTDPLHPPPPAELSRLTGLPKRKLGLLFRRHFGRTISEWLVEWRLIRAHDLLMGGDLSISDIAYSLGYAHLPAFSAAFARRFGASPRSLRATANLAPPTPRRSR